MATNTMSVPNNEAKTAVKPSANPAAKFRRDATQVAAALLAEWVGPDRAHEATGRISAALAASAASARNPKDFYDCTIQSIATCVAISALTGIMPGVGSTALAYVVPQRARKGEAPQLQYSLSHRGLNALSRRCGQTMVAVPIGVNDVIHATEDGDVAIESRDIDNPPLTFEDLRGVVVIVKEISSGVVLCRGWVPKTLIEQRRKMSRSFTGSNPQYSPWSTWPIEMAMKAAMHYAVSRGWCVIDDTSATRALNADVEGDARPLPSAPAPIGITDARSASEKLADRMEAATRPPEPEAAEEESPATQPEPTEPAAEPAAVNTRHHPQPGEEATAYFKRVTREIRESQSQAALQEIGEGIIAAAQANVLNDDQLVSLTDRAAVRSEELHHAADAGALLT